MSNGTHLLCIMETNPNSNQSSGGLARADSLSKERRHEIAAKAAQARWARPKATHKGILRIGDARIPCAVLDNGRRIITEHGITNAILGSRSGASKRLKKAAESEGALLPLFLAPSNLKPFIDNGLSSGPLIPIVYEDEGSIQQGYDANSKVVTTADQMSQDVINLIQ